MSHQTLNFSYKKKNINVKYFLFDTELSFHIGKPYNLTSNAFIYNKNKDDDKLSNLKNIFIRIICAYEEITNDNKVQISKVLKKYKIHKDVILEELIMEISNFIMARYDL